MEDAVRAAGTMAPPAQTEAVAATTEAAGSEAAPSSPEAAPATGAPDRAQALAEGIGASSLLAGAGGFLDAFTYFGHGHVFANAMTGNVVLLGAEAAARNWREALHHLPPIVMFLLGVSAARALQLPRARRVLPNSYAAVLSIEMAMLAVLAALPARAPDILLTAPIAFAASMQVQTFRNVAGYSYNSTFTTGNLRMLAVGLFDWAMAGERQAESQPEVQLGTRAKARETARVFAIICGAFLLGAIAGGFGVSHLGNRALLLEIALLGIVLARVQQR